MASGDAPHGGPRADREGAEALLCLLPPAGQGEVLLEHGAEAEQVRVIAQVVADLKRRRVRRGGGGV